MPSLKMSQIPDPKHPNAVVRAAVVHDDATFGRLYFTVLCTVDEDNLYHMWDMTVMGDLDRERVFKNYREALSKI